MREQRDIASESHPSSDVVAPDRDDFARNYLLVREHGVTRVFELEEGNSLIVGRADEVTIQLEDAKSSRRHAKVKRLDGTLVLTDLASRNGTRLNGDTLSGAERRLSSSDVIRIGNAEIVVGAAMGHPEIKGDILPADRGDDERRVARESDEARRADFPEGMLVADPSMGKVLTVARRLSRVDTNVLILGEPAVGKEIIARQIHAWSLRGGRPILRLDCASLSEGALERELFGSPPETRALRDGKRLGYLEASSGGTLLLDGVGELSPALQAKLADKLAFDSRIISLTHRDLEAEARDGKFDAKLFNRLNTFTLKIPPLRQRSAEAALLAELFLRTIAARDGRPPMKLDHTAGRAVESHRWPGNARELRLAIEHAARNAREGTITLADLPDNVPRAYPRTGEIVRLEPGLIASARALEET